jgi:dihydrofolate reductase
VATSIDGYIDKPGVDWQSTEDWQFFSQLLEDSDSVIMGSTTYLANESRIKPSPNKPRVVMTHSPEFYSNRARPGIEFSNESPQAILARLAMNGSRSTLLAGGSQIYGLYLDAGLVDEMYITTEPVILGSGTIMVSGLSSAVNKLTLQGVTPLNQTGTIVSHYSVSKAGDIS